MNTPKSLLVDHIQLHPMSCAASGMEAILKLHEKIPSNDFRFQKEFEGTNIGFEKLARLSEFGVSANSRLYTVDESMTLLENEVDEGRFPMVALITNNGSAHITIACLEGESVTLIDPAKIGEPIASGRDDVRKILEDAGKRRGCGRVDIATYTIL